jgi:hypothetical protein
VYLPQEQATGCGSLKIAALVLMAAFLLTVLVVRPSNSLRVAVITTSNAAMGL